MDAAAHGDVDAQYAFARAYGAGDGITQDPRMAVRYFKLAADQGSAEAQVALGMRYDRGVGTAQNPEEAARYFKMAANQNDPDPQRLTTWNLCEYRGAGRCLLYSKSC